MTVKIVASLFVFTLITACAHEPTAIESTMVKPGGKPAEAIPSVAATSSFDDKDQAVTIEHFNKAMESAPTGQLVTWTNPSGVTVQLTVTHSYQQPDSTYCREFTQSILSRDQPSVTKGTACRQSDATWQIIG